MKRRLGLVLLVLSLAARLDAAVAFDSVSTSRAAASSSISWSHTTTTSADRILFVFVGGWNGTGRTATATYAGTSMTQASVTALSSGNDILWVFRLAAPATGANTVAVTITGGTMHVLGGALTFSGAHQTDFAVPVEAVSTMSEELSSVSVSSAAGDMIADGVITGADLTHVAAGAASHTERWDNSFVGEGESGAGGTTDGSASAQSIDWSFGVASWAATGVWVKAAGGAAPAPKRLTLLGVGDD